jgi:hypothetical protein
MSVHSVLFAVFSVAWCDTDISCVISCLFGYVVWFLCLMLVHLFGKGGGTIALLIGFKVLCLKGCRLSPSYVSLANLAPRNAMNSYGFSASCSEML